eukprot:365627-Pelagomonas_calceolata.AAC.7
MSDAMLGRVRGLYLLRVVCDDVLIIWCLKHPFALQPWRSIDVSGLQVFKKPPPITGHLCAPFFAGCRCMRQLGGLVCCCKGQTASARKPLGMGKIVGPHAGSSRLFLQAIHSASSYPISLVHYRIRRGARSARQPCMQPENIKSGPRSWRR